MAVSDAASIRITQGPLAWGVFRFGFPMAIAMTLHGLFNLVDAYFVAKLPNPEVPLAAITNCDPVLMIASIIGHGVATASVALISRSQGRGDIQAVRAMAGQSLLLAALVSAFFGVAGALCAPLIADLMGAEGPVRELSASYMATMFAGLFSMILLLQMTSILRAVGHVRGPTIVLISANLLNVILDPFLIDAEAILGISGLPSFGLLGAAYATIFSRLVGCVLVLWLATRVPDLLPKRGEWRPHADAMRKLVSLAIPNAAQLIVRVAAVIALVTIVNHAYSTEADQTVTAAFGIGVRLDMLVMFGAMGWGAAATTYVGQNMGADQPQRAAFATWITAGYSAAMMCVAGVLMWVFAPEIVALFAGSSDEVAKAGTEYLRYLAPSYPLAAAGIAFSSALNGAGSMKAPAWIDTLAYGLLILPVALGLVVWGNAPTTGLWAVIAGGNALLAVSYVVWFRRGTWQRIAL